MNRIPRVVSIGAIVIALLLSTWTVSGAQGTEPVKEKAGGEDPSGMQPPTPGPEHALLAKSVGKWKAVVKMWMDPSQPPMVSEGITEVRSVCGGLWFQSDFKTTSGMPMEGHSWDGFDPKKGKYVGTWIDSWSTCFSPYEGTMDAAKKTLTCAMDTFDMSGKPCKMTTQTEFKDDNTQIFRMWNGPEPKGSPTMEMVYTRM